MSTRWKVGLAAASLWALDAAMMTHSGIGNPSSMYGGAGDVVRWELSFGLTASVAVLLAFSRVPRVNAWTCLATLSLLVGTDLTLPRFATLPALYVGYLLTGAATAAMVGFVLRYPGRRLSPRHRIWVLTVGALEVLGSLLDLLSLPAEAVGYTGTHWFVLPWPTWVLDHYVGPGWATVDVIAVVGTCVLQWRRLEAARGTARRGLLAMLLGFVLVGLISIATDVFSTLSVWSDASARALADWKSWDEGAYYAWAFAPAILALSSLVDLYERRAAYAAVTEQVLTAAQDGPSDLLDHAVRAALGDPTAHVDRHEEMLLFDEGSGFTDDPDLVQFVRGALRTGLGNARRRATRQARKTDLAESRARVVEAAIQERQRIERDLHDGVQQSLLGLSAVLSRAVLVAEPAQRRAVLQDASSRLHAAQQDLRRLVDGLRPAELAAGGLAGALPALASGASLDVRLAYDHDSLRGNVPDVIEATAYFVIAEALSNAVKHARAERVEVSLTMQAAVLTVSVLDDGIGGAHPTPGGGIAGLVERVAAVGGRLTAGPGPEGGSRVQAWLPCPR